MSANVQFGMNAVATAAKTGAKDGAAPSKGSTMLLPYDVMANLIGRRVTVLLSAPNEELEGVLRSVDDFRGDLYLEEVLHFRWKEVATGSPSATETSADASGSAKPKVKADRQLVGRMDSAMVNSTYIDLITPTLFSAQPQR